MTKKAAKGKGKKLTIRDKKFTSEVLKTGNATKAAIKAGFSKKSARQIAHRKLTKDYIREEIQSAAEKLGISAEYVLSGFKEIADFNKQTFKRKITKVTGEGSDAKIEEVEEVKMIDASASLKAHEMLGKHLKLFTDTVEVTGKDGKDLMSTEQLKLDIAKRMFLALKDPKILNNL